MDTSEQVAEGREHQRESRGRGRAMFAVLGAAFAGILGLFLGNVLSAIGWLPGNPFGTDAESRNTQVVNSLSLDEQVVLVSLGIQGIAEERIQSTVFGMNVPGSGRTSFLQYSYNAKLGIEGSEVKIEQKGEGEYLVTVPPFIFIGHENEEFKTVVEDKGVISFVTPEIDTADVITKVLSEEAKDEHIEANQEVLEAQAKAFYSGIIHAIDHEIDVDFEFRRERG